MSFQDLFFKGYPQGDTQLIKLTELLIQHGTSVDTKMDYDRWDVDSYLYNEYLTHGDGHRRLLMLTSKEM